MLALFFVLSLIFGVVVHSKCGQHGNHDKKLDRCFCNPGWQGTFCNKRYDDRCNSPSNLVGFRTRNTSDSSAERVSILASVYNCEDGNCTWSDWERLKLRPNGANKRENKACQDFQPGNTDYDDHFNDKGNIKGISIYNCDPEGWGIDYITIKVPSDKTEYIIDSFCGDLSVVSNYTDGLEYGLDTIEENSDLCMEEMNTTLYDGYWISSTAAQQIAVQFDKTICSKYDDVNYRYTCIGTSMDNLPDNSAVNLYCGFKIDFDSNNDNIDGGLVAGTLLGIIFLVCIVLMIGCNFQGIGDKLSPSDTKKPRSPRQHREKGGFRTISQVDDNYHQTAVELQEDRL